MQRPSGRTPTQLREIGIKRKFTRHAEGSVLVSFGDTQVICSLNLRARNAVHPEWRAFLVQPRIESVTLVQAGVSQRDDFL